MISFKNIITGHIFLLPKEKAVEIINQQPEIYDVISNEGKEILLKATKESSPIDITSDIYNLVVESDTPNEKVVKRQKKIGKKNISKKTVKKVKKEK